MLPNAPQQVVVGFDFTATSQPALVEALALAARMPSRILHIVCVIPPRRPIPGIAGTKVDYVYAEKVQEAMTREIQSQLVGAPGRMHFFVYARIGDEAEEILALAGEVGADLIVLGGHAHAGEAHVKIGTIAETILRDAGCTVEIVRPKAYPPVDLLTIVDAPPHDKYIPPHRYSYEETRIELRPRNWPLV